VISRFTKESLGEMDRRDGRALTPEERILEQDSEGLWTRIDMMGRRITLLLTHHQPANENKFHQQEKLWIPY